MVVPYGGVNVEQTEHGLHQVVVLVPKHSDEPVVRVVRGDGLLGPAPQGLQHQLYGAQTDSYRTGQDVN